jgi:8-oxo-dGTP diphosphatase
VVTSSAGSPMRARVVAALLRRHGRVLLCHRSVERRWYPDVWDLPGGHVEPGERPGEALIRELREELGIVVDVPSASPIALVRADDFDLRIWLVEVWSGTPSNAAPEEHDAVAWFERSALGSLRLAHDSYLATLTEALAPAIGDAASDPPLMPCSARYRLRW